MSAGTITNKITDPSSTALVGVVVNARLKPGPGFRLDNPGVEITSLESTTTDSSGDWSLNLEQNANINPGNTYWEVEERIPDSAGGPRVYAIQVGAGTASLYASLVSTPPDNSTAMYLTQSVGDGRYMPFGVLTLGSVQAVGTATATGTATTAASANHVHPLNPAIAGAALSIVAGALAVGVDDSTVEVSSDALRVKADGITSSHLASTMVPHVDWSGLVTPSTTRTKTATSWTNAFHDDDRLRYQNFVKRKTATKCLAFIDFQIFGSATGGTLDIGVEFNGVQYELGRHLSNDINAFHAVIVIGTFASGVAAGTYDVQVIWKGDGTNQFNVNTSTRGGLLVVETY